MRRRIAALLAVLTALLAFSQAPDVAILADRLLDVRAGRYVTAPRIEVVGRYWSMPPLSSRAAR